MLLAGQVVRGSAGLGLVTLAAVVRGHGFPFLNKGFPSRRGFSDVQTFGRIVQFSNQKVEVAATVCLKHVFRVESPIASCKGGPGWS